MPKRTRLHHDWLMKYLEDPDAAAGYLAAAAADDDTLTYSVARANVVEARRLSSAQTKTTCFSVLHRRLVCWWRSRKENDSCVH